MIHFNKINLDRINFNIPVKADNYYKSEILYDEQKLIILTDKLKLTGNQLEISDDFKTFINGLNENNVKNTYNNSKEWFKKEIPFEVINEMYLSKLNNNYLEINNNKNIELDNEEEVILLISGLRIERKTFTMDIELMDKSEKYNIMEYDLLEDIEENKKMELLKINDEKNKLLEELELIDNQKKIIEEKILELEEKEIRINNNNNNNNS